MGAAANAANVTANVAGVALAGQISSSVDNGKVNVHIKYLALARCRFATASSMHSLLLTFVK